MEGQAPMCIRVTWIIIDEMSYCSGYDCTRKGHRMS